MSDGIDKTIDNLDKRVERLEIGAAYRKITAEYLISVKERLDQLDRIESKHSSGAEPRDTGLDVDEAASLIGCRKGKVYEMVKDGILRGYRVGRLLKFTKKEIDDYITSQETGNSSINRTSQIKRPTKRGGEKRFSRRTGEKIRVDRTSLKERMGKWE